MFTTKLFIAPGVRLGMGLLSFLLIAQISSAQQTIRMHGAVTSAKLIQAQKEAFEAKVGVKLEIVGNGSGRGLTDLINGSADVAMVGASLKVMASSMNKEKPGSIDAAGLVEAPISKIKLALITHPSAGIKSLTMSQARDVLTGKIKNWKEVGGSDTPIKVVVPFPGDGSRITVREELLNGEDCSKDAVVRNSSKDVAAVVAQLPGSCAYLTVNNAEGNVIIIKTENEIYMPLVFVTKGEPTAEVKKILEESKTLFK